MSILDELIHDWRGEAARLRDRYAEERLARLCEAHAAELEAAIAANLDEVLSVCVAAAESGYSSSQIRRLFPDGRIRRRDLPRKARRSSPALAAGKGAEAPSGVEAKRTVSEDVRRRIDARFGRAGR